MDRAYSILEIRSVDEGQRIIEGVASTPTPDRMGDIVEPLGATFALPMPLLWQHDSRQPIGQVTFAKPTKTGIPFKARLASTDEPGTLKDRLDEAWQSIKLGLVRAVSIGFRALEYSRLEEGGLRFIKWEWLELSAVTIPAQAEATIDVIRSIDRAQLAPSGLSVARAVEVPPPSRGLPAVKAAITQAKERGSTMPKSIAEQIREFEATRQAKAARMSEIMAKSGEDGVSLDAETATEYDGLADEVKSIDAHLNRLNDLQGLDLQRAVPAAGGNADEGSRSRGGDGSGVARIIPGAQPIRVEIARESTLPKGIGFTRYVLAIARAKGNLPQALEIYRSNERWMKETPDIETVLKAAVAAGTTTDATWASPLVQYQNLASEFIEFLRPQTIMGRLNLRNVPFKIKVPRQTAGATVGWVGEGSPKPVSKLAFDQVSLDFAKIAGIVVITDELARHSAPSAEMLVRDDLGAAVVEFMDQSFIDPSLGATSVSPASITNGATHFDATGTDSDAFRNDARQLMQDFVAANLGLADGAWVMPSQQALAIGMMLNTLGQPLYPTINASGGTLFGLPVVPSEAVPNAGASPADGHPIVLLKQRDILLADEGQVTIDASREATLQMDDAPDSPVSGSTKLVSLWQQNMLGIRAEREINWIKRRSTSVAYIRNAKYE